MKFLKTTTIFLIAIFFLIPTTPLLSQSVDETFFIDSSIDKTGRSSIFATLQTISDRANFYVDNEYLEGLSSIEKINLNTKLVILGLEFDDVIYPTLTTTYGSEWNPGIDDDSKIYILISPLKANFAGFVDARNQKPKSQDPLSNEHEMIYLNSDIILNQNAKHTLAHEFVHLVEINQRQRQRGVTEQAWLSEALADYAPTALGYNDVFNNSYLSARVNDFLSSPTTSLTDWQGSSADFAVSNLFMHFLVGQWGKSTLAKLMQSSAVGADNIQQATGKTLGDVFLQWSVANYLNSPTTNGSEDYSYKQARLSYANLNIKNPISYSVFPDSEMAGRFGLKQGSSQWIKFTPSTLGSTGSNTLHISFEFGDDSLINSMPYITTNINGEVDVKYASAQNGLITIENFGNDILSVVVVPAYNILSSSSSSTIFDLTASLTTEDTETETPDTIPEGALIKAKDDPKVYVVKNGTKRWIPSVEIFNGYGHLRWQDIIEVSSDVLAQYTQSRLIKFIGDYRVYEVNQQGSVKQHLDITPAQFNASGRLWQAIYEVNQNEFSRYSTGAPITF